MKITNGLTFLIAEHILLFRFEDNLDFSFYLVVFMKMLIEIECSRLNRNSFRTRTLKVNLFEN